MSLKILYLGCHSVLEYQELRVFTEIVPLLNPGFEVEVFSLNGAYMNPLQSGDFMRSVIPHGKFYPDLYSLGLQCDKDTIHPELLDWCDMVFMTHNSAIPGQKEQQRWLVRNWEAIEKKGKICVWRSIGQSTPTLEKELLIYREKGLKILRCSPIEDKVPQYAGADAMIRFCEDPDEFSGWTGERQHVVTMAQSFKKRGDHLRFDLFERITEGFHHKVIGTGNEDLGDIWIGQRSYHELIDELRKARVFYYFGTIPVPYTLSFVEAFLMGIPVVAVGAKLREHHVYNWPNYEIPDIIANGINGYVSNDIQELRGYIKLLMEDTDTAKRIGEAGRKTALELFAKKKIMGEWVIFLRQFVK